MILRPTSLTKALDDILEQERALLLEGNMDALPSLLTRKRKLIDQLESVFSDEEPGLTTLKNKAHRNHALLKNTLSGIREGINLLTSLQRKQGSFETYDRSGQRTYVSPNLHSRMEKRS